MARNKDDNIASQVGGWLGGAAKGVQSWSESQARTFTNPYINAAGRALGKNPNLPTSGSKEAVSNTAFAVADIVAPVIGRAATAAVRSGRAAVKGTYLGVHGSPTKGLPAITPQLGPTTRANNLGAKSAGYKVPGNPVAYSYPAQPKYVTDGLQTASAYAKEGSVYVVKAPKQNVNIAQWNPNEVYSSQSMQVVKEIKIPSLPKPAAPYASKDVKQSVEASISAARAAADAKMIRQVQNAVKKQKVKTFLKGATRPR